ncbi:MAG: GNAT family N-acetyltransferase [Dehalococcoidia bacterium]|nr:GNAT family N-acetyltransferase [Dehalococcoidia bacterium]
MQSERANNPTESTAIVGMVPDQVEAVGKLVYEAFRDVAIRHGFKPIYESLDFATLHMRNLSRREGFTSFVAIEGGQPLAVNFLDQRNDIAGVGPVAVGVEHQGRGLGRMVMEALLEQAEVSGFQSVRLLQTAYNMVSFSLYCRLGFDAKEEIAFLRGRPPDDERTVGAIRECTPQDLDALDDLSLDVLGFRRRGDVKTIMPFVRPLVVEREGRLVGFVCRFPTPSGILMGPAVARDEEALKDLIVGAARLAPGDLRPVVPVSCPSLLRWALQAGFSLSELGTLMVRGTYEAPAGASMPSIWY